MNLTSTLSVLMESGEPITVHPAKPYTDADPRIAALLGDTRLPWSVQVGRNGDGLRLWFDDPADVARLRDALTAALEAAGVPL